MGESTANSFSVGLRLESGCQKKELLGPVEWLFRNSQGTILLRAKHRKRPGMVPRGGRWGGGVRSACSGGCWERCQATRLEIWASLGHRGPWGLGELDSVTWTQPSQTLRGRGQLLPSLPSKGCLGPSSLWGSAFLSLDLTDALSCAVW